MHCSRRNVLKIGAGAAALWITGCAGKSDRDTAAEKAKKIPIGLQLYSVRQQCEKDLSGVLAAVAAMGYQGVEFAGYYGRTADELKKLLDANGLKCCGTHTGWNTVQPKELQRTIEFNKTIGNRYLIVPGLPREREVSADACRETGKLFTDIAAKVKPQDMVVGYHAHGGDFRKFDGETAWDLIFSNSSPDVSMQMDIGNCIDGGGDPYATLRKFPGRSLTIHLKEHGGPPGAAVGEGDVRWNEVFQICESTSGTNWYIVEHESDPKTPLESVKKCIDNLRKMGK